MGRVAQAVLPFLLKHIQTLLMLQILSTSNETATGAELVQNGNFSEVGSDLVTNGDFSAGVEFVDYPNFTNSDLSQWNIADTGGVDRATKSWDAAEFMRLTYDIATGAAMLGNFDHTYPASYKVTMSVRGTKADGTTAQGSAFKSIGENNNLGEVVSNPTLTSAWQDYEFYVVSVGGNFRFYLESAEVGDLVDFNSISVKELGEGWTLETGWSIGENKAIADTTVNLDMQQDCLATNKNYKVSFDIADLEVGGLLLVSAANFVDYKTITSNGSHVVYIRTTTNTDLNIRGKGYSFNVTNITVQELDPNDYWTLSNTSRLSIGDDKGIYNAAIFTDNFINTSPTLVNNKTCRATFDLIDFSSGGICWNSVNGKTLSENFTEGGEGLTFDFIGDGSAGVKGVACTVSGDNTFAITNLSIKQLGTYSDQSIYVTAADVQTIAQDDVYYLIELTSMGSKNSLYFLPSSVVPNNGRYTKLNFTVISKDALQQPTEGVISFYDSVGGFDTYPMGFYEFKIYEQTSSTNLDPLLATGLLEKGFAFVRDFSGNMQELTDGFKEYTPALTQYVYSK